MPPIHSSGSYKEALGDGISAKRLRGEISCAECRRLKLRCDKKVPCASCVKRGCQVICPNGSLTSGRGSRYILADTEELHTSLAKLSERIRMLENALSLERSLHSVEPHELLSPHLLEIKHINTKRDISSAEEAAGTEINRDILRAFGDLTLSERQNDGESLLLSPIYEALVRGPSTKEASYGDSYPSQIAHLIQSFPISSAPFSRQESQRFMEKFLPSYEHATALCESYLQTTACWVRVEREQLFEELLPSVYKRGRNSQGGSPYLQDDERDMVHPHDLALLFSVLALGVACDVTQPLDSPEAKIYNDMTRAALGLHSIFEQTTISTLQALMLYCAFDMYSFRTPSLDKTWRTISVTLTLAASIGLHKDPDSQIFEPKIAHRRRALFWELRFLDTWKSLGSGKPLGVHPDDVTCQIPSTSTGSLFNTDLTPDFWQLKHRVTQNVLLKFCAAFNSAKLLKYADVIDLDHKLHNFQESDIFKQGLLHIQSEKFHVTEGVRVYLHYYVSSMMKDMALQLLHRNFFARALIDKPENPYSSSFAYSFRQALESASSLLQTLRKLSKEIPQVLLRYWSIWAHTLTSCVVLGSVAVRAPTIEIALQIYAELLLSVECLKKALIHPAIKSSLPVIQRLSEKAHEELSKAGRDPDTIRKTLGLEVDADIAVYSNYPSTQNDTTLNWPVDMKTSSTKTTLSSFLLQGLREPSVFAPIDPNPDIQFNVQTHNRNWDPLDPVILNAASTNNVMDTDNSYSILMEDLNLSMLNNSNFTDTFGFSNHGAADLMDFGIADSNSQGTVASLLAQYGLGYDR